MVSAFEDIPLLVTEYGVAALKALNMILLGGPVEHVVLRSALDSLKPTRASATPVLSTNISAPTVSVMVSFPYTFDLSFLFRVGYCSLVGLFTDSPLGSSFSKKKPATKPPLLA